MKIKKGDTIKIISGKDRGKTAKVLRVDVKAGRILSEGINLKKKHVRPKTQGKRGEIIQMPAFFPVSAAMIVCPACKTATRVGILIVGGEKKRVCKKCKAEL
ncbi:MAG: 50S ribosomal protein L24 [Parcubacteria group bacterium GW2011_GWB1_52_7]|nr:MAG: 50S ribosomal protein L24 [Parcubacteria group bacterium GW2011_GWA1_51_12]KKW27891.1 MAG: 50S ribosomal protein L24 [Parcubacteria group bacterium GW2011_GWB1_52_7]